MEVLARPSDEVFRSLCPPKPVQSFAGGLLDGLKVPWTAWFCPGLGPLALASNRWPRPSKDPVSRMLAWMARQDPTAIDQPGNPVPIEKPNPWPTSNQASPQGCLGYDLFGVGQRTGAAELGRFRGLLDPATAGPGDQSPRTAAAPRAIRLGAVEPSPGELTDPLPSAIRSDLRDAGDPPGQKSHR